MSEELSPGDYAAARFRLFVRGAHTNGGVALVRHDSKGGPTYIMSVRIDYVDGTSGFMPIGTIFTSPDTDLDDLIP